VRSELPVRSFKNRGRRTMKSKELLTGVFAFLLFAFFSVDGFGQQVASSKTLFCKKKTIKKNRSEMKMRKKVVARGEKAIKEIFAKTPIAPPKIER
jgi:hypothetical protein